MSEALGRRQAQGETQYPAAALLLRAEGELANYSAWIAGLFARDFRRSFPGGGRVLDFGAGPGILAQGFLERTGVRPEGVELDPALRALLIQRGFAGYSSTAELAGCYEAVFSSNVLEHIPDDLAALRDLHERLEPGGILLLYVPAFQAIWTRLDDRVGHFRRYTRKDLAAKLTAAGFKVEHSRYCDSVGFLLALAFRVIGSRNGEPSAWSLRLFDRFLFPISRFLDHFTNRFFGKNVYLKAIRKPIAPLPPAEGRG